MGRINWETLLPLKSVIENSDSFELAAPVECVQSDFIRAALRAAKHCKSSARRDILKDVSLMLNCRPEDLSFLFEAVAAKNTAQVYKLDLPDYRLQSSEIYLEAAE